MKDEKLREVIGELAEGAMIIDYKDQAIVGVTNDFRVVYDLDLLIDAFVDEEGMSEDDAIDWIDYNVMGTHGEQEPVYMTHTRRDLEELKDLNSLLKQVHEMKQKNAIVETLEEIRVSVNIRKETARKNKQWLEELSAELLTVENLAIAAAQE